MRLSMTFDQGSEMSKHKTLTKNTGVTVYFAHPHAPWERGICENTNGLLRQYLPKEPTCLCFPKNSSTRSHGNSIPDRERHSAGKLLRNCSSQKALSILPTTGQTSVRAHFQLSFLRGPLKSGKQTALPTFQQPRLLECYKSIQTVSLHLEFVPAHPSFVREPA